MLFTKNKKGQLRDIILLMVILVSVGATIVFGRYILTNFTSAFYNTTTSLSTSAPYHTNITPSMDALANMTTQYATFDYGMLIVVICMIIGLFITSFMIPTHPAFVIVNIIGIFILVFIGMVMSNLYADIMTTDAGIEAEAGYFPTINWFIGYLPYIGAVLILITSIIMYARGAV